MFKVAFVTCTGGRAALPLTEHPNAARSPGTPAAGQPVTDSALGKPTLIHV